MHLENHLVTIDFDASKDVSEMNGPSTAPQDLINPSLKRGIISSPNTALDRHGGGPKVKKFKVPTTVVPLRPADEHGEFRTFENHLRPTQSHWDEPKYNNIDRNFIEGRGNDSSSIFAATHSNSTVIADVMRHKHTVPPLSRVNVNAAYCVTENELDEIWNIDGGVMKSGVGESPFALSMLGYSTSEPRRYPPNEDADHKSGCRPIECNDTSSRNPLYEQVEYAARVGWDMRPESQKKPGLLVQNLENTSAEVIKSANPFFDCHQTACTSNNPREYDRQALLTSQVSNQFPNSTITSSLHSPNNLKSNVSSSSTFLLPESDSEEENCQYDNYTRGDCDNHAGGSYNESEEEDDDLPLAELTFRRDDTNHRRSGSEEYGSTVVCDQINKSENLLNSSAPPTMSELLTTTTNSNSNLETSLLSENGFMALNNNQIQIIESNAESIYSSNLKEYFANNYFKSDSLGDICESW